MIKKHPKKFADILSYDYTKSKLRKHGIFKVVKKSNMYSFYFIKIASKIL